jgi:DNA (cytosine-5)-methyltransferase 1
VLDDIEMPWMLVSSLFPDGADEEPTLEDAIGDLRLDNENSVEAHELREIMKKGAKYKWLKRLPKNPDKVMSVGDDIVGPFYDKLIAHRTKWGKEVPERKTSFFQSRRVPWHQASHTLSEQGLQTSLAVNLHPDEDRGYTTKEAKRLMSLPEDYILTGTLNERLARIGLMVAPMMMKYVAASIYEKVLEPYNEVHNSKD